MLYFALNSMSAVTVSLRNGTTLFWSAKLRQRGLEWLMANRRGEIFSTHLAVPCKIS